MKIPTSMAAATTAFPFPPSIPPTTIRFPLRPTTVHCLPNAETLLLHHLNITSEHLTSLLQKHPSLSSSPPEPLRLLLPVLGPSLSLKRPELLTSPHVPPFLSFLRSHLPDLHPSKLSRLLSSVHLPSLSNFPPNALLLLSRDLPSHLFLRINLKKALCDRSPSDLQLFLSYLDSLGGFDLLLRRPQLLNLDLRSQLIPRVDYLTRLAGGDSHAARALICKLPFVLAYTVNHYESHVAFWKSVGVGEDELFKVAMVYPNIFSVSKERKLCPRVEFLKQCGLGSGELSRFLIKAPLFLSLSFEGNLAKKLCLLVKIGYRPRTRELAAALGAATRTSCENMQRVVGVLLGYGFSCEDMLTMSRKQPQVLQYNYASLEEKVEYLVGEMGREIGELLAFPAFLGYKLDDRIKKRYEAKRSTRGRKLSINKLLSVSKERFYWSDEDGVEEDGEAMEVDSGQQELDGLDCGNGTSNLHSEVRSSDLWRHHHFLSSVTTPFVV